MITLNLDTVGFTSKPTGAAIGGIRNRLARPEAMRTIDPAELIAVIQQGRSFTPAAMTGGSGDTWQSQQVIVADIDNDTGTKDAEGRKIRLAEPLTPDQALAALAEHGITPYAMYWTFSNRPDWPKFRIVLVLGEAIKTPQAARELTARLAYVLNAAREHCTDTSMADTARLLFGGRSDCVFYQSGQTTPAAQLWSLPTATAPKAAPAAERPKVARKSTGGSLQDRLDDDIKSFDLAQFMECDGGRLVKRGRNTFINPCPICGHRDCMQVTRSVWHCHSSNHSGINSGTIIDYMMARDGLTTGEALEKFKFEIMGYDRDEWEADREARKAEWLKSPAGEAWLQKHRSPASDDFDDLDTEPTPDAAPGEVQDIAEALAEPAPDYRDYLRQTVDNLAQDIEAQELLARNGISVETARECHIGYDANWDGDGKGDGPTFIIPSTTAHYVAWDVGRIEPGHMIHMGKPAIMGVDFLYSEYESVYVCDNALSALSIRERGGAAIALFDNACVKRLLTMMENRPTPATLIICIGGSDGHNKAADRLRQGLRRLNVSYLDAPALTGDLNAMLMKDLELFDAALLAATDPRPDNVTLYIDNLMGSDLRRREEIGVRATGFKNLDAATHGGLRPGLYLFGAVSSLGKTTFCSQLADGLAENGAEVLYFSLEQSKLEMVTKSLSREMARIDLKQAVSSGAISDNRLTAAQRALLGRAAESYKAKVGDRISIIEAGFNADTDLITNYVRQYIERTGKRPVIFIDYLQVLKSGELVKRKNQGTREMVEDVISQLVLLKRDLDLTIICIVSLNRASYQQHFDFESIKESGLCEYSGDVIWGLELRILDENNLFDDDKKNIKKKEAIMKAKAEIPRRVKLCSIKHRGQNAFYNCYFDYRPQFDLFVEADPPTPERNPKKEGVKYEF